MTDTHVSTPDVKMKEDHDIVEMGFLVHGKSTDAWASCGEGADCCLLIGAVIQAQLYSPSRQEAGHKSWQYVRASCANPVWTVIELAVLVF